MGREGIVEADRVSETYRQSSSHQPAYRELDPGNHMLSRAPRFRVSAEEIGDITLHAAGLLRR